MSGAGLAALFLILVFVRLAAPAPLLERKYDVPARYDGYDIGLTARASAHLFARDLDFEGPLFPRGDAEEKFGHDFGTEQDEHIKRGYDLLTHPQCGLADSRFEYGKRDVSEVHTLHRRSLASRIRNAFRHAFHKIGEGFKKFGHAVKAGFQKAGHAIKIGFQKAGHAIKTGFQKFGQKAKQGFKKVGAVLKKGFQKVGHFLKTTGAKIAKFGLKVVSAIASVASKIVKFIPGVGEGLSIAVKGLAKGADIASNKIHANLGKKLEKAMHGMDYVISPIGTAAKAAGKKAGAGSVVADLLT